MPYGLDVFWKIVINIWELCQSNREKRFTPQCLLMPEKPNDTGIFHFLFSSPYMFWIQPCAWQIWLGSSVQRVSCNTANTHYTLINQNTLLHTLLISQITYWCMHAKFNIFSAIYCNSVSESSQFRFFMQWTVRLVRVGGGVDGQVKWH